MVSAAEAQKFREAQQGIRVLVDRDLNRLWSQVWGKDADPAHVRDLFLDRVPRLVERYGTDAASLAAQWYEVQREAAGVGGRFAALPSGSPYLDVVEPAVRRTAGALWTPTPADMLTGLTAVIGKYVLAAGRQTIADNAGRDPKARGWGRVTRRGACNFCRMLAGRGGVYTEASVHFAAHGDCNCAAAPNWDRNAPEVDVAMYQASQRTSRMTPEQRETHNARIQGWMAAHQGEF